MKDKKVVIIGGGISGLSLAYLLAQDERLDITVLEAASRAGGKIGSERINGFLCEKGPGGFLDNKPKTLELCQHLGIQTLASSDAAKHRYLYTKAKLKELPASPPAFLKSDILSWPAKLRMPLEMFIAKGPEDESVSEFVSRRLGHEALEQLIDPMVSGVYAGDPDKMSIKSAFPRIKQLEQEYGSLIKAMLKIRKQRRREAKNKAEAKVDITPGGRLRSFAGGVQELTDQLATKLGSMLVNNAGVTGIEKRDSTYLVHGARDNIECDIVVLATPAHTSKQIVDSIDTSLSETLGKIPYPHVSVVCLGYEKSKVPHPLNGFGFLIPSKERRQILGTLWDSSIFPNRAPQGSVLLRTMIGGARYPELGQLDQNALLDIVLSELKTILAISAEPNMAQVYSWPQAIPQYQNSHQELLNSIDSKLRSYPGLYITGNAYRGIGMNDCITNSYRLADTILATLDA